MYISARLLQVEKKTPTRKTLFPKVKENGVYDTSKLTCMLSRKIPVTCTELSVIPNGPLELLLVVINFCHEHEITLVVEPTENTEESFTVLKFNTCTGCGARFSSAFHFECPHCGGWGYEPYFAKSDEIYKKEILEETKGE